tara:strand:+ start:11336 stop:12523 length:1188 start_codon:yes stop_codon:yes gene_type:complete
MSDVSKLAAKAARHNHSMLEKEAIGLQTLFGVGRDLLKYKGAIGRGAKGAWEGAKGAWKAKRGPVGEAILGKPKWKRPALDVKSFAPTGKTIPNTTSDALKTLAVRGANRTSQAVQRAAHSVHPNLVDPKATRGQGLLSTLARAGALGTGVMGAKDLATLPFGGWNNKDELGGMRRGGLDYQRQAINPANVGAAQAAINALGSPVKSLASLPFGDPDASPVGYGDPTTTTSSAGVKRQTYAPQAVGPAAVRKQRELTEARTRYKTLQEGKRSELEKARADYEGGTYPDAPEGRWPWSDTPYEGNEAGRRMVEKAMAKAKIEKLRSELSSGEYGGTTGWFTRERPSAADLQKTISDRRRYLSASGLGSMAGGGSGSPWGGPSATRRRELQLRELGY